MHHKTNTIASSLRKGLSLALLLGAAAVQASPVTVDYTVYYNGNQVWGTGSFTGNDNNNNGFLSLNELTSFNGSNNIEHANVTLAGLSGFGEFDIGHNLWLANGFGWGQNGIAYFSWNGANNSVNSRWAHTATVETGGNTVPEPGSLALGAIAMLGLVAARRKAK